MTFVKLTGIHPETKEHFALYVQPEAILRVNEALPEDRKRVSTINAIVLVDRDGSYGVVESAEQVLERYQEAAF